MRRSFTRLLGRGGFWKLAIALLLTGFILFGNRGVFQRVGLEREQIRLIERIRESESETVRLREQLRRVSADDAFIEKIARERYGMIRSGDTVYRTAEE
jgi:cell division protein FtsB